MIPGPLRRALETFTHPHSLDQVGAAFRRNWTGEHVGVVTKVEALTPRSSLITFRTNSAWPGHVAGQYVPVGLELDGRRFTRTYSLTSPSSRKGARTVSIGVQRVPDGVVSNALNDVAVGTVLFLGDVMGDFVLPTTLGPDTPLLLIGGGSGMTPIRALLADLEALAVAGAVVPDTTVISYAPSEGERLFAADLDALEARHDWLTVHRIELGADIDDLSKRLGPALLDRLVSDWSERCAYACGPASLLDDAEASYLAAGRTDQLVVERFTRHLPPRDGLAEAAEVSVSLRGAATTLTLPTNTSLLDSIESAGQLAPSGCRNGICHTCSVELIDGCAINLRDGRISEPGSHVQLCICAPLTDLTLAL